MKDKKKEIISRLNEINDDINILDQNDVEKFAKLEGCGHPCIETDLISHLIQKEKDKLITEAKQLEFQLRGMLNVE